MNTLPKSERRTVSVDEAAKTLGIGRGLAYELAQRGELPGAMRLGRRFVVSVALLDRALGIEPGAHESEDESPVAA